jgi:hypothetical protein
MEVAIILMRKGIWCETKNSQPQCIEGDRFVALDGGRAILFAFGVTGLFFNVWFVSDITQNKDWCTSWDVVGWDTSL